MTTGDSVPLVRRLWWQFELHHALVYFAPEARDEYAAVGLRGGWMGYFASRSAPMGAVTAGVVTATFRNFAPRLVERAIPAAWQLSTPERVIAARYAVVTTALRRMLGEHDGLDSSVVVDAGGLLRAAVEECDPAGRPLYRSHAELAWPDEPHLVLWQAATLLREHRFDGHVAALTVEGLDGVESLITASASGGLDATGLRSFRGWTEEEWEAGEERLRERGLLDGSGALTADGYRVREAVEARTDQLAAEPLRRLGESQTVRLIELVRLLGERLIAAGAVPYPNPVGVPRP